MDVRTHRQLTDCIKQILGDGVQVRHVNPHPALSCMICLWVGNRRWVLPRRLFRQRIATASRSRGLHSRNRRADKWEQQSTAAVAGLKMLEWNRLRRIVGLGPWGEQLLLRLKLQAFSLYDPVRAQVGCPIKAAFDKTRSTCIMSSGLVPPPGYFFT
ncbi:reverse transcriptase [Phytophthora megakarya]|uniref:Reverse transcriptase n=1 Tax=Phytophthora megakarya TaxID=4795 RepID=A0A225VD10_9STRA|nr:reverse transcriptase [Phytophthora megakarya]